MFVQKLLQIIQSYFEYFKTFLGYHFFVKVFYRFIKLEAAGLSGQRWGFECGRPGFKSLTRTTECICPRCSQGQIHHAL